MPIDEIPIGFWEREASHYPRPLTPLVDDLFIGGINQAFPKVFAAAGLLAETLEFRSIGGYVYAHFKPFGVPERADGGGMPPKPVLWLLLRLHPAFRRRNADCKRALEERLHAQWVARWTSEWRPRLKTEIAAWRAKDFAVLSDADLAAAMLDLRRFVFEACDIHFYLAVGYGIPLARVAFFCRDELGYDDMQSFRLFSGLSGASSEPALALARLADRIRGDVALTSTLLAASPGDVASTLRAQRVELGDAFDAYHDEYGYRALRYEVNEPTLGEQPEVLGRLLQDQLRAPNDLAAEQERLAHERASAQVAAIAALPDDTARRRFKQLLADAETAYPVREDNEFFTISMPLAICRFAAVEAGARLVRANMIALPEDVFFLNSDEIADALRGVTGDYADRAAERRAAVVEADAFDPPASYGAQPPEPPLSLLPPAQREAMSAAAYLQERIFETQQSGVRTPAGAREIRGRAAARGTYTGTARVIMGEHEFDRLQSGDVLVCPITSPVWSVLFSKVGALVTDSGGILSHPAIIAREYGIPAVVATGNGTQLISDGQRIEVDGTAGVVRVVGAVAATASAAATPAAS